MQSVPAGRWQHKNSLQLRSLTDAMIYLPITGDKRYYASNRTVSGFPAIQELSRGGNENTDTRSG
jgi:hypothetical protein